MNSIARPPRVAAWAGFASIATVIAAQVYSIMTSPPDKDMGDLQKIMYVHVPAAWMTFIAFFVVFVCSVKYMWKGKENDDLLAASAAEVGAVLTALTLVLGSIWGRPTWGIWWTWDPRLTMTVILWTMYAVYLVLRTVGRDDPQIARYAAVLAIVAVLDVPLIMVSVRLWRGMHPSVISAPAGTGGIQDSRMIVTLLVTLVAFASLFLWLLWRRYEGLRLDAELHALEDEISAGAIPGALRGSR